MANPSIIFGANLVLTPAPGDEDSVQDLHAWRAPDLVVSQWQLSEEELKDVVASGGKVYLAVVGETIAPAFVASEHAMRAFARETSGEEMPWQPRPTDADNVN